MGDAKDRSYGVALAQADTVTPVVVVDVRVGHTLHTRFSASCEKTSTVPGFGEVKTWNWIGGRATETTIEGDVHGFTDVMQGMTQCKADATPEVLALLMVESWLVNHGESWFVPGAVTAGERDLSGKVLRNDEMTAELELKEIQP